MHYGDVAMGGGTSRLIQIYQLYLSFYQRPNISDKFVNLASHFIRVQIFQIYFSLKFSLQLPYSALVASQRLADVAMTQFERFPLSTHLPVEEK